MNYTTEQIYVAIVQKCGLINAPRLLIEPLPGDEAARFDWVTAGRGLNQRTIDQTITIDPNFFADLNPEQVTAILSHELAHWICHWQCISGGDATSDGQNHGPRFLATWLWIWKTLGKDGEGISNEAHWHAQAYGLTEQQTQRAINAAMIADTPRDAISAARPPVNKKAELLFWLRAAGWTTLAACGLALIWD